MAETNAAVDLRLARRIASDGDASRRFTSALRGIAIDGDDRIFAVGDAAVRVFDAEGTLLRQWPTRSPGWSIAVDDDDRVWVGQQGQVEIFDGKGDLLDTWRDSERLGLVTAIAVSSDEVLLADAKARCIRRFDHEGKFRNNIGDQHRKGGFDIPTGVIDFALDDEGRIHVPNPGMHRVERYTAAGELVGRFGRFDGRDPAGFPGCCNPTNLTLDGAGRVIVSEKAGPRVKIYDPSGKLLTVVTDDLFDPGAKNIDLAIDSVGRLYAVDTVKLEILVFEPASP
jgi:sugar lactone lactonase YvrE